jgi:hypothetical protein
MVVQRPSRITRITNFAKWTTVLVAVTFGALIGKEAGPEVTRYWARTPVVDLLEAVGLAIFYIFLSLLIIVPTYRVIRNAWQRRDKHRSMTESDFNAALHGHREMERGDF